jgi:serine/threonine-protein kinase HipA
MDRPTRGKVFYRDLLAGSVEEREGNCIFTYHPDYLARADASPISLVLPLRPEPYSEKTMIPFFDGLIPEGWLLEISARNWKLDPRDRMGLLLSVCEDCIGAVSVVAEHA